MPGPTFPQRVYAIVRQVPRGRVITYGAVARLLGDPRKAREVGWAMATCGRETHPVPAHRVINASGEVSGGSALARRKKLEAEGVVFTDDGRIDLDRFLWIPDEVSGSGATPCEES